MFTPASVKVTNANLSEWQNTCRTIVAHAYSELGDLIEKEVRYGDTITYLSIEEEVVSFFITRTISTNYIGQLDSFVYFGLSGTSATSLHQGIRTRCVEHRFNELRAECDGQVYALVSTAFPTTYLLTERLCDRVSPDRNGNISEEDYSAFSKFMRAMHPHRVTENKPIPFVQRRISTARYLQEFSSRTEELTHKIPIFKSANLIEQDGDRLFYLCILQQRTSL